jgi:hypothetical protein
MCIRVQMSVGARNIVFCGAVISSSMAYSILDTNDFHVTLDTVMDQHWVGTLQTSRPRTMRSVRGLRFISVGLVSFVPVMRDLATALARHRRHA